MRWKLYAKVQRPEKWASSWEKGFSSLLQGEWSVAEVQRQMTQGEVKLYAKVQRIEKRASSWEEGLSSLAEGEWSVAELELSPKKG